ncbi:hypothetical protein DEU56DRAFT_820097 [Suillus clintonianus]|uniref:uncharacterized protein n=1 Tax=Suillus clintonianus TaxID=1904413 RepID=UPI001B884F54|nr:uncharacterized protein DEU56DRAFT_820097 [Suillus clintonianus]KAG2127694.1 hypothetical protein DEU56DRAFT_820097 [Suillus clintonianus]
MKKELYGPYPTTDHDPVVNRSSPATTDVLMKELNLPQPAPIDRLVQTIPEGIPKAHRFVAEMEGLTEFVGGGEADVFHGFAMVFENAEEGRREGFEVAGDVKIIVGVEFKTLQSLRRVPKFMVMRTK